MAQTHSLDLERSSSQSASIADNASTSPTGDLTIEAWIKLESVLGASASMAFVSKGYEGNTQRAFNFSYNTFGGSFIGFSVCSDGNGGTSSQVSWTPVAGVWYHVACVYTASAGSVSYYINGRQHSTTQTGLETSIHNSTATLYIGDDGAGSYFDGLMKDVRIFSEARTITEIKADLIAQNVVDANLLAEWNFNNSYADSSGNGNTLTGNNSPTFASTIVDGLRTLSLFTDANLKAYFPFDQNSLYDPIGGVTATAGAGSTSISGGKYGYGRNLDGAGSSLTTVPYSAQFAMSSMKTISFWAKKLTNAGSIEIGVDNANTSSGATHLFRLNFNNGPVVSFSLGASGGDISTSSIASDLDWHHYCWTHNGNINNTKLYYDGVEVASGTTNAVIGNNSTDIVFGARFDGVVPADFVLDDFSVFDRQLSAIEVATIYGALSVTATPSAQVATFSLPASTVALVQTVTPSAQVATFSIPAVNVLTPDVTVSPSAQVATFSIPAYTAKTEVSLSVATQQATFSIPTASVAISYTATPAVQALTFSVQPYSVSGDANVSPSAKTLTFSVPSYTPFISSLVEANVFILTFTIPDPPIRGRIWGDKFSSNHGSFDWQDKHSGSHGDLDWGNKY